MKELLKPEHTALLVIDLQADYCSYEGAFPRYLREEDQCLGNTSPIEAMIPRLEELIQKARNKGHPIIWSRMTEEQSKMPKNYLLAYTYFGERPVDLCVKGTPGHDFYKLRPEQNDLVIDKDTYDLFLNKKFLEEINDKGIDTFLVTGMLAGVCVRSTVEGGARNGKKMIVIGDLVGNYQDRMDGHKGLLCDMVPFAGVTDSQQVLKILNETTSSP